MCSKKLIIFYAMFLIIISSRLSAALNFQQEMTLSSFQSEECTKELVNQFLRAAIGDSDLKVVDLRYVQEKLANDFIEYKAIIMCHVSEIDKDIIRVSGKMVHNYNDSVKKVLLKKPELSLRDELEPTPATTSDSPVDKNSGDKFSP